MENKTTLTKLSALEAFVEYCIYLMVQLVNKNGLRSAHSDVLGPKCLKTLAGGNEYFFLMTFAPKIFLCSAFFNFCCS